MLASDGPRVVLATGRYIGEGFDDPRLDTLMLPTPIAWKGTMTQYAGRRHRHPRRRPRCIDGAGPRIPAPELGTCGRSIASSRDGRANGQDIVVLVKLAVQDEDWTVRSLEAALGIPRAGVHRSLQRLSAAGLY